MKDVLSFSRKISRTTQENTEQALCEYYEFIKHIPFAFPYSIPDTLPHIWVEPLDNTDIEGVSQKNKAEVEYDREQDKLILRIPNDKKLFRYEYYHEFTHPLDSNYYEREKKKTREGLFCFTEYHASQLELLQLIGFESDGDKFSYKKMITINNSRAPIITVMQYWNYIIEENAFEFLIKKQCFQTLFPLFYYWGYRSIFKLYSDANESIYSTLRANKRYNQIMRVLQSTFHQELILLEDMMNGWLDAPKTEEAIEICDKMLASADLQ